MIRYAIPLLAGLFVFAHGSMVSAVEVTAAVLRVDYPTQAPISRLDEVPDNLGFAGAELATEDNQTTGQFMGQTYETRMVATPPEAAGEAFDALMAEGIQLVAVLARGDDLLALADRAPEGVLILNAGARETALRDMECRANVLHVTPSHAMLADAVAQFAIWKKWPEWLLVRGSNPEDKLLADAYRVAASKFGAKFADEIEIEDTGGGRRTDTGHVLVQKQLPVLVQTRRAHDIVIAADASDNFAPYLPFHLWTPRPVMGSAGLRPVSFSPAHEAWGATQFQRRFDETAGRYVREEDYDTWLALRVIGEAVTRTNSADPSVLREYILSEEFELAAFKGQKVTFRTWNGQLRQPILLFDGRITAAVSPQDGFLHQDSPLDTLGLSAPVSRCDAF